MDSLTSQVQGSGHSIAPIVTVIVREYLGESLFTHHHSGGSPPNHNNNHGIIIFTSKTPNLRECSIQEINARKIATSLGGCKKKVGTEMYDGNILYSSCTVMANRDISTSGCNPLEHVRNKRHPICQHKGHDSCFVISLQWIVNSLLLRARKDIGPLGAVFLFSIITRSP